MKKDITLYPLSQEYFFKIQVLYTTIFFSLLLAVLSFSLYTSYSISYKRFKNGNKLILNNYYKSKINLILNVPIKL